MSEVYHRGDVVMASALLLLAVSYFTATQRGENSYLRRALATVGAIAFIPLVFATIIAAIEDFHYTWQTKHALPFNWQATGWMLGVGAPLLLAFLLRGKDVWLNGLSAVWVIVLAWICMQEKAEDDPLVYLWCLLGAIGMIYWGVREFRKERINIGFASFVITVLGFYFSNFLDKFGRANALISLGLVFLLGGWFLEKTRRRLVAKIS